MCLWLQMCVSLTNYTGKKTISQPSWMAYLITNYVSLAGYKGKKNLYQPSFMASHTKKWVAICTLVDYGASRYAPGY